MSPEELEAILERAARATPGPWRVVERGGGPDADDCSSILWIGAESGDRPEFAWLDPDEATDADAEFIAHARMDVPRLLARLTEVEGERDEARAARDAWQESTRVERIRAEEALTENARLRQQVGEIGDALDREHAFEKAHIATIAQWRPVVEAAKALLAAFAGGTPWPVFRDAKRALESALQEAPETALISNLSPPEAEVEPDSTDEVGEQGEAQGADQADLEAALADGRTWGEIKAAAAEAMEYGRKVAKALDAALGEPVDREQIPPSLHSEGGSGHKVTASVGRTEQDGPLLPYRWACSTCGAGGDNRDEARAHAGLAPLAPTRTIDEATVRAVDADGASDFTVLRSHVQPDSPWLEEAMQAMRLASLAYHGDEPGCPWEQLHRTERAWYEAMARAALPLITRGVLLEAAARLKDHYLADIFCDHERKMDNPRCSCSLVHLGWYPSVGEAAAAWVDHALAPLRERAARRVTG